MYLLLLAACIRTPCGKGTHTEAGTCVADADDSAAPDSGDADTDADADTDSDADADADSDTDADADSDTDADADSDADSDTDTDTDADADILPAGRWSGDATLPDTAYAINGSEYGDAWGFSLATGDEDGDGQTDLLVGSPYADRKGTDAGSACLIHGPFTSDADLAHADGCADGSAGRDYFGAAVAMAGDLDGDGIGEVAISAPTSDLTEDAADGPGVVYLFSGFAGTVDPADAVAAWTGEGTKDGVGRGLVGGTDFTGDGLADLVIAGFGWSGSDGAAYVIAKHAFDGGTLDEADVRFYSLDDSAGAGFGAQVVDLGDLNGDGASDLGVGWAAYGSGGGIAIFLGPLSGANAAEDATAVVSGRGGVFAMMPGASASPGDIDGDGVGDLLLGASQTASNGDNSGTAYIIAGDKALAGTDVQLADASIEGDRTNAQMGRAVSGLGDHDGDGHADVVIGEYGASTACVFYGPLSGTYTASEADASWDGGGRVAGVGTALVGGVELTGDSYSDLVIGVPGATGDADYSGVVYIVPGVAP